MHVTFLVWSVGLGLDDLIWVLYRPMREFSPSSSLLPTFPRSLVHNSLRHLFAVCFIGIRFDWPDSIPFFFPSAAFRNKLKYLSLRPTHRKKNSIISDSHTMVLHQAPSNDGTLANDNMSSSSNTVDGYDDGNGDNPEPPLGSQLESFPPLFITRSNVLSSPSVRMEPAQSSDSSHNARRWFILSLSCLLLFGNYFGNQSGYERVHS